MSAEYLLRGKLEGKAFVAGKETLRPNEIPSISVSAETLPDAWETAFLATLEFGANIPTEYDQPIDPESRDASVMITATDPLKEPRIHKLLPGGYADLEVYVREVVDGIHDSWVRNGGWSYSYHDRLFSWPGIGSWEKMGKKEGADLEVPNINQIDALIRKLALAPHTRRAQAITWVPHVDSEHHEPPCLQRVWCRLVKSENDVYLLEMNTHWRSRDALKAAFMNMYVLTELQKKMAEQISDMSGRKVGVGRYVDISDSFHIYGSYLRKNDVVWFLSAIGKSGFENRIIRSDDPRVQEEFAIGRQRVLGAKDSH